MWSTTAPYLTPLLPSKKIIPRMMSRSCWVAACQSAGARGHKVSNYSGITSQLDTDSSSFLSDILTTCSASSQSTHAISLLSLAPVSRSSPCRVIYSDLAGLDVDGDRSLPMSPSRSTTLPEGLAYKFKFVLNL